MKLTLLEKQIELPGVETFVFKPTEALTWKAGQYCHYVLHHEPTDDRGSDRWFTVSSAPYEELIKITTRISDDKPSSFKKKLISLEIGKSIEISTVGGSFIIDDLDQEYVFIAGGIGITPFHSILKQLDYENKNIKATLLYANRDEHITYKNELEALALRNTDLIIHHIISPDRIDEAKIKKLVTDITIPIFYISGPEPMVDSMEIILKDMGVEKTHIKKDGFPGYI